MGLIYFETHRFLQKNAHARTSHHAHTRARTRIYSHTQLQFFLLRTGYYIGIIKRILKHYNFDLSLHETFATDILSFLLDVSYISKIITKRPLETIVII